MMLLTLIRKEIVSHVLSLRFGVTFILFILLVFASIYVTTNQYQRDLRQWSARGRMATDHLEEILKEENDWRRRRRLLNWEGRLDAVGVPALSSVAQGLHPFTPVAVNTGAEWHRNIGQESGKNPLAGLLRIPDLVYVVSVVLSLLAVLFAFDSICGEKESGTLRLILSNAVPRDRILLAKWIGGYLVLVIPFLIAALGGLGYAWWHGSLELSEENVKRLGLLVVVACLYISVFFTLTVFISTTTHRSATSLFVCLFIWVMWILVIPNLAPVVAKIISPTDSVEKINAEKEAVSREIGLRIERLRLTSGELWYGQKMKQEVAKLEQEGQRRRRRWDSFLEEKMRRQTSLAQTLGRISPAVCWTYSATSLMNTGPENYEQFKKARKRLTNDLRDFGKELRDKWEKTGSWAFTAEDVPSLQVERMDLETAAGNALNDILIMLIVNVVFFMAAFVFFLRYDVR